MIKTLCVCDRCGEQVDKEMGYYFKSDSFDNAFRYKFPWKGFKLCEACTMALAKFMKKGIGE